MYHFKSGAWGPMKFGNINAWASMCKSVRLGKKMSFILEQIKSLNKLKSSTLIRINPFEMDRLEATTIYYVCFHAHQKGWVYPNQCGAIYLNGLAKSKNFHFYLQYCKQFGLFRNKRKFCSFSIGKGPVLPVFGPKYGRGKSLTDAYFSTCYINNFLIIFVSC